MMGDLDLSATNRSGPQLMFEDSTYNVTSFDRSFLHWSVIVLEVVAIVVIVVGDISVLMLFFTRKLLGQSTNILVFSLAIGDLLTGILTFPLAMLQKILYEPSEFLCKGYFYFANVSKTAVSYTILLLAMERIAVLLSHTFRILPPGRCLFFASLTWFFSAAYNIWSVVIYDMETITLDPSSLEGDQSAFTMCFASTRFMYLHAIFEYLNPLVTFAFPVVSTTLLFVGYWLKKHKTDKPGRPYKSSRSVVIFTFALLVSFTVSHLPWEIGNLVFIHDASTHQTKQLVVLRGLHIFSFCRGFWNIFIFGGFRRYVCKKEKALQHFREQRSLQVPRTSLAIPMADRPASLSILDSDPSVSRRYSSDYTISRRPSSGEESCMIPGVAALNNENSSSSAIGEHQHLHHHHQLQQHLQVTTALETHRSHHPDDDGENKASAATTTTSTTTTSTTSKLPPTAGVSKVPVLVENCLIPRSPCFHQQPRRFSFVTITSPDTIVRDVPVYGGQLHVPKFRHGNSRHSTSRRSASTKTKHKPETDYAHAQNDRENESESESSKLLDAEDDDSSTNGNSNSSSNSNGNNPLPTTSPKDNISCSNSSSSLLFPCRHNSIDRRKSAPDGAKNFGN